MRLIPNPEKHLGDPQMRIFSFLIEPSGPRISQERGRRGPGLKGRWRIGVREGCYACSNVSICQARGGGDSAYERGGDARRKF